MKSVFQKTTACIGGALLFAQPVLAQTIKEKPNLLIIMTDQQRWDAIRCAGNPEIKTPNMDRLANEGVQFLNAYSACPVSVPARTSILTGRTTFNNKVLGNGDIESDSVPKFQTFDMILSANGYHAEYYGKYHSPYQFTAPYDNPVRPTNKSKFTDIQSNVNAYREYLDAIGVPIRMPEANERIDKSSLRPYIPLPIDGHYGIKEEDLERKRAGGTKDPLDAQSASFGTLQSPPDGSLTAFEGYEALEALKRIKPGVPFSMTCSFGPPHPPFVIPEPYASLYNLDKLSVPASISDNLENAPYQRSVTPFDQRFSDPEMIKQFKSVYYGMVSQVDEWVGKLLDELDKKGLTENTLVIFVSDHGEMLGDHGMNSKMKMYEGSVHVPLIMRLPRVIPAGIKVSTPVSHLDLFATILDYTGMKIPENDGRSLRSLINGKNDPVDYAVSTWGTINNAGPFMIRKGDWKLIAYLQLDGQKKKNISALYNLKTDPLEINNLIGSNPEKAKYDEVLADLKKTLRSWMVKTKTPYLSELDNTKF